MRSRTRTLVFVHVYAHANTTRQVKHTHAAVIKGLFLKVMADKTKHCMWLCEGMHGCGCVAVSVRLKRD